MNKKHKQFISVAVWVATVALLVFGYYYLSKPSKPPVGERGEISGNYSLAGIMSLDSPYICTFKKSDGVSSIFGTFHIDGDNAYGDFRITTETTDRKMFQSFLLIKNKDAYSWTSLAPVGYKSQAAKSAFTNASPNEQAQIIGIRDILQYECKPWGNPEPSYFEVPSNISFQ